MIPQTTSLLTIGISGPLLAAIANCVTKVKAEGIKGAGDFSGPKVAAAKPGAPTETEAHGASPKAAKSVSKAGTGFVISPNGHIVTNQHVVAGCGDIRGNLTGEPSTTLRLVSSDESNDLALLQGPATSFKEFARIRDRSIRSGDSVVTI